MCASMLCYVMLYVVLCYVCVVQWNGFILYHRNSMFMSKQQVTYMQIQHSTILNKMMLTDNFHIWHGQKQGRFFQHITRICALAPLYSFIFLRSIKKTNPCIKYCVMYAWKKYYVRFSEIYQSEWIIFYLFLFIYFSYAE